MSTDYAHPTRLECKRLLESIGVSVVVQNSEGMALLKCRITERRGASLSCLTCPSRSSS